MCTFSTNSHDTDNSAYVRWSNGFTQGATKRCPLSWLTNSALVNESKCRGVGGSSGFSATSAAVLCPVHRSPNKLWRSNSIFNLWFHGLTKSLRVYGRQGRLPEFRKRVFAIAFLLSCQTIKSIQIRKLHEFLYNCSYSFINLIHKKYAHC